MTLVERLRLGGPNAAEVADQAAREISLLRAACREALDFIAARHQTLGSEKWDDGDAHDVALRLEAALVEDDA